MPALATIALNYVMKKIFASPSCKKKIPCLKNGQRFPKLALLDKKVIDHDSIRHFSCFWALWQWHPLNIVTKYQRYRLVCRTIQEALFLLRANLEAGKFSLYLDFSLEDHNTKPVQISCAFTSNVQSWVIWKLDRLYTKSVFPSTWISKVELLLPVSLFL